LEFPECGKATTFTTLLSMKKDELHDICKKYHIKVGKNKQQYVDNIKERSKTVHEKGNQFKTLKNSFSTDNLADPAPLHEFYQDHFNLVDLVDRYCYKVEEYHHQKQW